MIINFRSSNQNYAVNFPKKIIGIFLGVFIFLTLIFSTFYLFPKPHSEPGNLTTQQFFGLAMVNFSLVVMVSLIVLFYNFKLKHLTKPPVFDHENFNIVDFFDFQAANAVYNAINYAQNKKITVSTTILTDEIFKNYKIKFIFDHLNLNFSVIKKHIHSTKPQDAPTTDKYSQEFLSVLKECSNLIVGGQKQIGIIDLLLALIKYDRVLRYLMINFKISEEDFIGAANWLKFNERLTRPLRFFDPEYLVRFKGIGKDWAYGYTPHLDKYSVDLTEELEHKELKFHIIGHNQEIESMERVLAKAGENNVVLIGEPGTGRRIVILGFTQRVNYGSTYSNLAYKRVVELDMNSLIAGLRSTFELSQRLGDILEEAQRAGNIIIFINDFHNFLTGTLDIKETLIPYLKSQRFQFIGLTDTYNYHQIIEFNPTLKGLFEKIEVKEATEEETITILQDILFTIEKTNKVIVTYQALRKIIELTARFDINGRFPEKAISPLNEAITSTIKNRVKILKPEIIDKILSNKLGFQLGEIGKEEKEKLLNLERLLHGEIINQERAVSVIVQALQKSRVGLVRKKPIGSFLFLGPTGVGKTQTAKALSKVYFNNSPMIRLDLTEYQEADSIKRLLGVAAENITSSFLNKVRLQPFSVILLDEIEKAHKNILNLFLQVLDEGYLTDDYGQKTSFLNSIIIATSNAGSEFIRQKIATGVDLKTLETELIDYVLKNHIFSPEFINRFDAPVVFTPLTKEHLVKIAAILLEEINQKLKSKQLEIIITDELLNKLAEIGYDKVFGARALNRVISEQIESFIAKGILEERYKPGEKIDVFKAIKL